MSKTKKIIIAIALLLAVPLSFNLGFKIGQGSKLGSLTAQLLAYSENSRASGDTQDSFVANMYFEVWDALKTGHVDKNKIKDQELFYGSLKGLAQAVDDPYTVFLDPADTQDLLEDLTGVFEGIGAEIGLRDDIITVIAPLDDMPAKQAGVLAGDRIYAIDGEPTIGLTLDEAVKRIKGPKGTIVTLTIIRGTGETKEIEIERGVIVVKSVKTELRADGLAVVRISNFNDDTLKLFNRATDELLAAGAKGIILDLRNNPGGYLDTSIDIASAWISSGPIVAEQFADNKREEYFARGVARLAEIPTVVLLNGGSASASEIVAGALRDYKKATLVGEQTFGKGSVQSIQGLSDGSSLKITVAKWLTPAGDFINDKGISPDIEVGLTIDDFNNDRDPQLDQAIKTLKEIIKARK
ncbi:MAG: S41 family peptidase [Patescibacteria group bacterium]|jgi:carboxyl-terminal processing protease